MQILANADVSGKKVFLRCDLDVPVDQPSAISHEHLVKDDSRLKASLPTIQYLLDHGATVIVAGHLGRPEGVDLTLSLKPIAEWYSSKLETGNLKFEQMGNLEGWKLGEHLFVLENLRFNSGEESNDPAFTKQLSSIADIYVNDAFGVSHRTHCSIVGIAQLLPHFAGLQLQKEVEELSKVLDNPERPLVVIVGGAKIETKMPLIEKMHRVADYVLVGGKLAQETQELLKVQHEKVEDKKGKLVVASLIEDGTDITGESVESFLNIIGKAKTIIWNGPLGLVQSAESQRDAGLASAKFKIQNSNEKVKSTTEKIAEGIIKSGAYSVVGGGDTIEVLDANGLTDKFSFVSTGGGAMLAFLSGEKLPGLEALLKSH